MLVGREVNRNIIVGTRIYIATEYAYPRDACGLCVERYSSDCECNPPRVFFSSADVDGDGA
jgi:hypothetical protein